jgi:hypothetical protein
MIGIGPQKCPRNSRRGFTFFSGSSLYPNVSRRRATSASLRPSCPVSRRDSSTEGRRSLYFF